MTIDQKFDCIRKKRVCGRCLLPGHKAFKCSAKISEIATIVCRQLSGNESAKEVAESNTGSNNVLSSTVILKTIMLRVKGRNNIITVRGFLDDGNQRSYISTKLAKMIDGKYLGKYFEKNTLFGGIVTGIEERSIYEVDIFGQSNDKYKLNLATKDKITGSIIKLPHGPWMDELKALDIHISDCESSIEDIDILLGADVLTKVEIGENIWMKNGLKAVETLFGWTIMGPIPTETHLNTTMYTTVSSVNEASIAQLWELDTIDIQDPIEV